LLFGFEGVVVEVKWEEGLLQWLFLEHGQHCASVGGGEGREMKIPDVEGGSSERLAGGYQLLMKLGTRWSIGKTSKWLGSGAETSR
jgi:hypothetical protein